jgi:hypothetical protein
MGGQTAKNARNREAEPEKGSGDRNNRQRHDQKNDQRQAAQNVMQEFGLRGGGQMFAERFHRGTSVYVARLFSYLHIHVKNFLRTFQKHNRNMP